MPGHAIEKSVKQKVIELYIAAAGCISPHEITATLKQQGCRISYGSVWKTLDAYKLGLEEHSAASDSNSNKVQL